MGGGLRLEQQLLLRLLLLLLRLLLPLLGQVHPPPSALLLRKVRSRGLGRVLVLLLERKETHTLIVSSVFVSKEDGAKGKTGRTGE